MAKITRAEDLFWPTPGHPVETITNLDAVPIAENHEPLVRLDRTCPELRLAPMGSQGGKVVVPLWTRASLAPLLVEVQAELIRRRPGTVLVIVDAWRSPGMQQKWHRRARIFFRLLHPSWSPEFIREAANKYVAAPDAAAPPPHSTGGAIDVRLWDERGKELPMGGWTRGRARTGFEALPTVARDNRRLLCESMEIVGFSNYEEEWWHYSYGDSGWALRTNRKEALYGRTTPPET